MSAPPSPLRITSEDLAGAQLPPSPPEPRPPVSQLALASFVLALLGIPLVGLLLGPIAICFGLVAVSALRRGGLSGLGLAIAGVAIGALDLVAWTVALFLVLSRPVAAPAPPDRPEAARGAPAGIEDAPPRIRRALEANAVVRCRAPRGPEALGSGVVLGGEGTTWLVVTNRHVVDCAGDEGGHALTAATAGQRPAPAEIAWRAPDGIDAVILRVKGEATPRARAARAAATPRVGDAVFVVGNPLGYEATYTAGVLSAVRTATWGAHRLRVYQVQAAVNHGNSGGGLYDAGGRLIGLVTWTAAKDAAEGLGFAIATDELFALLEESAPPDLAALGRGGEEGGPTP